MQTYSDPKREADPHALPNIEVFYADQAPYSDAPGADNPPEGDTSGWYWWACFPGCLPDGEASGPFKTAAEAETDAQDI